MLEHNLVPSISLSVFISAVVAKSRCHDIASDQVPRAVVSHLEEEEREIIVDESVPNRPLQKLIATALRDRKMNLANDEKTQE